MRELLHALPRLRANPMFTIAATVTPDLTIGASASVFSVVDAVRLLAELGALPCAAYR